MTAQLMKLVVLSCLVAASGLSVRAADAAGLTPAEARVIARDAYIYGYPMVDNYRIQYSYFVDKNNP